MLATWLLERPQRLDEASLREVLAANLCRCTGYQGILDAVRAAARTLGRWDEAGGISTRG
jgi:carbon-monoxide dehydrogenase small subunit